MRRVRPVSQQELLKMAMTARPFNDADLFLYSEEHVSYEIDMFFGMTEMLSPPNKIGAGSIAEAKRLNFAMIEAFVVHLRNLIDFLYINNPQPTDVVASDFCAAWQTIRPPISMTLESARVRANKELAHLTTTRLTGAPPAKRWDFPAFAGEIGPLLHLFIKNARVSALSPVVRRVIR
jgi:hypothetical protein